MRIMTLSLALILSLQGLAIADSNVLLKLRNPNQAGIIINYEALCEEEGVSATGATLKQMCEVVTKSELCAKVEKGDLFQCSTLDRNIIASHAINKWDMLVGCAKGAFNSVADTLKFFWDVMTWAWDNSTSSEARGKTSEAVSQVANAAKLYLHTEYQKAYAKASPPMQDVKAMMTMNQVIGKMIFDKVVGFLEEQSTEFGCLNEEAKTKRICKVAGDIFLPPTGALALIKYGSKGLKQLPKFARYFQASKPAKVVEVITFAKLTEKFPNLDVTLKNISEKPVPNVAQVEEVDKIPYNLSNQFRPVKDLEMVQRAKDLPPEMKDTIKSVYNTLNNPTHLKTYFQDLFKETAEWMAKRGRPEDLQLLEQGRISKHAINVVIVRRLKARNDLNFTTIYRRADKNGNYIVPGSNKVAEEAAKDPNGAFRAAVRTGPFVDRGFNDTARANHGIFTHMFQRDIVHKAVSESTKGDPKKFYDFLGSKKGVNFWADLFDSDNGRSFTRPEVLTEYINHKMTTNTDDVLPVVPPPVPKEAK